MTCLWEDGLYQMLVIPRVGAPLLGPPRASDEQLWNVLHHLFIKGLFYYIVCMSFLPIVYHMHACLRRPEEGTGPPGLE